MWSTGALITALFGGDSIFAIQANRCCHDPNEMDDQIFRAAIKGDLSELQIHELWGQMSVHAIDMVKKLLVPDKNGRLGAIAALSHPWFSSDESAPEPKYRGLLADWHGSRLPLDFEGEVESYIKARNWTSKVVRFKSVQYSL